MFAYFLIDLEDVKLEKKKSHKDDDGFHPF